LIPATQHELPRPNPQTRRGRIQMILLLLFCAAPVIASYLAYYVFKLEGGKTNFGLLVTHLDITHNQDIQEIAVTPKFRPVNSGVATWR